MSLPALTPEQRVEMREKAAISKQLKKEASSNIVTFTDEDHWRTIASEMGVRMPLSVCQSSEHKHVKRIARKLGVDVNVWVRDVVGARTLSDISDANPNAGAVGVCGWFLEHCYELKGLNK